MSQAGGDLAGAVRLYRRLTERLARLTDRILERRPELGDLLRQSRMNLVSGLYELGYYAEAIQVLDTMVEAYPDQARDWRRDRAIMRVAKGDVDAGLAELRSLAEEEPGDPLGWLALGAEARIAGYLDESRAALERAVGAAKAAKDQGQMAAAQYQRFLLFKEMGQLGDAMEAWEAAVRQEPDVSQSVHELYHALTAAGRYTDALRYVAREENALRAGLQRGLIASHTGKPIEARDAWSAVAAMNPDSFDSGHAAWVEAVLRLGDPMPALEWLGANLVARVTPRLLVLAGIAWAMQADADLAADLFQQAISVLRRQRPPKKKLDSADWRLLDSLVDDDEVKQALRPYFAVVETLWSARSI
jgi:tetratricopeptide (TPR) repeat protein